LHKGQLPALRFNAYSTPPLCNSSSCTIDRGQSGLLCSQETTRCDELFKPPNINEHLGALFEMSKNNHSAIPNKSVTFGVDKSLSEQIPDNQFLHCKLASEALR
jgi:hypothetical protein